MTLQIPRENSTIIPVSFGIGLTLAGQYFLGLLAICVGVFFYLKTLLSDEDSELNVTLFQYYDELSAQIKKFMNDSVPEIRSYIQKLNERYEPVNWIKSHRLLTSIIVLALTMITIYPLMAVWALACLGTGYPGYAIIRSMISDRENRRQNQITEIEISEFIHSAIADQRIIQIPLRHNSAIRNRSVIIRGEFQDGISVKDPETGIQSKYLWDNIDLGIFYMNYVKKTDRTLRVL